MKNKIKMYVLLTIAFSVFLALIIRLSMQDNEAIECSADLLINRGVNSLNMTIAQKLDNGKGVWIMSGSIFQDNKKYFIGKTVEFDYSINGDLYKLTSTAIQNSPQFDIPKELEGIWLTKFTLTKGEALTLRIKKLNKNNWIVYSRTIPLYMCEK